MITWCDLMNCFIFLWFGCKKSFLINSFKRSVFIWYKISKFPSWLTSKFSLSWLNRLWCCYNCITFDLVRRFIDSFLSFGYLKSLRILALQIISEINHWWILLAFLKRLSHQFFLFLSWRVLNKMIVIHFLFKF